MDCYRTCDIRGRYPEELNEDLFYHFGQSIARKLLNGAPILLGSDVRPSSIPLKQALADGLVSSGVKVFDAGRAPTPVLYYTKRKLGSFAAAIVTASHNPPAQNGLKLLLGRYPATAAQLRSLRPDNPVGLRKSRAAKLERVDLSEAYVDFLVETWRERRLEPGRQPSFKLVLDPGNGAWTLVVPEILRRLEFPASVIHDEPDGLFPNRSPDCAAPGTLLALSEQVRRRGASAGFAWDGDGDRVAVLDETGARVYMDHLVLLMLPDLLRGTRGEKVLYDVKMSRRLRGAIEAEGATAVIERSAHCFLERRMIDDNCIFGCEYSGHLFFRSLAGVDDGMYAALLVTDFLLRRDQPLSKLVVHLPQLFITPDLRIPGGQGEFESIRRRLREEFAPSEVSLFDGIRVETANAWFLVRPSVSEHKLSFRFEAETSDALQGIVERVERLLPEHGFPLREQLQRREAAWGA